jgi:hypothetical protein
LGVWGSPVRFRPSRLRRRSADPRTSFCLYKGCLPTKLSSTDCSLPPLRIMIRRLPWAARTAAACAVLSLVIVQAGGAQAHAAPPSLQIIAGPGLTRVFDRWSGTLGAEVTVHVGSGIRVGGGATRVLRTLTGGSLRSGQPGDLRSGSGGAVVDFDLDRQGRVAMGLMVGGGHVTLTDPVTGTLSDADSFFMVEPRVTVALPVHDGFGILSRAAFRQCRGLSGLRELDDRECRGVVMVFGASYRH